MTREEKLLQSMYTKRPAAFGIAKNIRKSTNLRKQFLVNKSAIARLKVIAYDIKENFSLDLPHVDKLSMENTGVKQLLIAVDCF